MLPILLRQNNPQPNKNKAPNWPKEILPGHVTFLSLPPLTSSAPLKKPCHLFLQTCQPLQFCRGREVDQIMVDHKLSYVLSLRLHSLHFLGRAAHVPVAVGCVVIGLPISPRSYTFPATHWLKRCEQQSQVSRTGPVIT